VISVDGGVMIGQAVSHYKILARCCDGGMGVVWPLRDLLQSLMRRGPTMRC